MLIFFLVDSNAYILTLGSFSVYFHFSESRIFVTLFPLKFGQYDKEKNRALFCSITMHHDGTTVSSTCLVKPNVSR